jgi:hypothetical protein
VPIDRRGLSILRAAEGELLELRRVAPSLRQPTAVAK